MTAHNHAPCCCCPTLTELGVMTIREQDACPLCVEHGELAQLAEPECPSCHTVAGHPHTEYCQLSAPCADLEPHRAHIRFDDSPHTNCPGRP